MRSVRILVAVVVGCGVPGAIEGATALAAPGHESASHWMSSLEWRGVGPARGGRAQTVAGVVGDTRMHYMGAIGSSRRMFPHSMRWSSASACRRS